MGYKYEKTYECYRLLQLNVRQKSVQIKRSTYNESATSSLNKLQNFN